VNAQGLRPTADDIAARQALEAAGILRAPVAGETVELTPERAVFLALAWHLAETEATVERDNGGFEALRFAEARDSWPDQWEPSDLPAAVIQSEFVRESDALIGTPCRIAGEDVVTDELGLWVKGEDTGEARVTIFAAYQPHADALRAAVEKALEGDLNKFQSLILPLPQAAIPEAFRDRFAGADALRVRLFLARSTGAKSAALEDQGITNRWRADVRFGWQALRLTARLRIPDLVATATVTVETS
jgi:hypothetical protein